MTDRQDKDTMDKLGPMELMGTADSWVSMVLMVLMDLVVYIPVECHRHQKSLQLHHLGVHRLYRTKHETIIISVLISESEEKEDAETI